jgi:hypothetical protein
LALALGIKPPAAFAQPRPSALRPRDERLRIELDRHPAGVLVARLGRFAFALPAFLRLAKRLAAALAGAEVFGQLVAALGAVALILATIDLRRFLEDFARDPPEVTVRVDRRVRRHLRPVDRHHTDRRQPRPTAEAEHAAKDLAERALVAAAELSDRRMIRHQIARHDPNATSSTQARSIPRADRVPRAYA